MIVQILARAPVAGEVKTRLIPGLGACRAAKLQRWMTDRAIATALDAALGPVELWCAPDRGHPAVEALVRERPLSLHDQLDGDLGARMAGALAHGVAAAGSALLIGSDCPFLTADDLRAAACALARGRDAVLVPACDGGYVLIGLRRVDARLFTGVEWGGSEVLKATRARLAQLTWQWTELAPRSDIDRPEDLALLAPLWMSGNGSNAGV